jgi:translation initiation factor RLI1
MFNFLKRVRLSFRRARAQRRPIINNEECIHFMANVITSYHCYPHI